MNRRKRALGKAQQHIGLLLLWFVPFTLAGQRYVSGRITDAEDGNPIPAATVFISNTTAGITTDMEGYYRLRIPGEGSYQLTVSHVGYQSVFKDIEPGNSSIQFDVALQIIELEELTVATRVRFRQRDINLFWKTILGKDPSRRTIQATNPEVVYYYYNAETRILKVTCREPLQIVNNETGYHIQYVLENFTHDYNTDISDWRSQCNFTELEPENLTQQNNWKKKRQEVYQVSLTKFIKSLYNNTLQDDGFVLGTFHRNTDPDNPYQISLSLNRFLVPTITDNSKTLSFFSEHILICYGRPVTADDLLMIQRTRGSDLIQSKGLLMNLLNGNAIQIYPDGTYINRLQVTPVNTSNALTDLSMRLPLDYLPDGSMPSATADAMAENINGFDNIFQLFDKQLSVFPQEKIHVHTDRDMYVSGEKIQFKAYVTDALTHLYPTNSRYVYVELISPVDTLINRVMVRPVDGMFYGHLPLTEYVPTGNYTLRAYTRYMENLGDDYFFKKNIRIENLSSAANQQRPVAHRGMLKDDFNVSFFPEGGNMPEGVLNKIAFKALNINGYPDKITGALIDENGVEMASVATFYAGMGIFEYIPEAGKRIYLKCRNINGLEKQFELPQPDLQAYALTATRKENDLLIEIRHAVNTPDIACYLLAHCRGKVLYFAEWENEKEGILFVEEEFPAGIIQFILFDERMNPLSERLVFSKNYDEDVVQVDFQTDKVLYEKREKVIATLMLQTPSPLERAGVRSHLSVAITDDKDITVDSMTTILSTLLLTSELKGYIENPAWYLQDNSASVTALDYLMLTHGWRRYIIPDVVGGNPGYPQIPFQMSQTISGKVITPARTKTVPDSEISILTKEGDFGLTSTDAQGTFTFQDFEYPDSTSFFLQALSRRGSNWVELVVDGESFPKLIHATQSPIAEIPIIKEETKEEPEAEAFITKAEQRARYDDDMWVIQLGEIEITASRMAKKDEARLQFWANASSNVTIQREEIEKLNYISISDHIYAILLKYFNKGPSTYEAGTDLLILIDGIPFPPESVDDQLHISAAESIDVFHGVSATAFGVRGANGVISITTQKGSAGLSLENDDSNYTVYTPLGYQKPVEFYSPKYETLEAKHLTIPDFRTTLFWKPDIVISEDEEEATFEFYTSDFQTTYSVVIEGLTTDGKIVRQVEKIQVK